MQHPTYNTLPTVQIFKDASFSCKVLVMILVWITIWRHHNTVGKFSSSQCASCSTRISYWVKLHKYLEKKTQWQQNVTWSETNAMERIRPCHNQEVPYHQVVLESLDFVLDHACHTLHGHLPEFLQTKEQTVSWLTSCIAWLREQEYSLSHTHTCTHADTHNPTTHTSHTHENTRVSHSACSCLLLPETQLVTEGRNS